jgi:hypothetical protein
VRLPDGAIGFGCDDDDPTVYPGAPSLPDGNDNNSDGITDLTDSDGDGIPDEIEVLLGTDPHNPDGDGLWDGFEVGPTSTPRDTDGDGVLDADEGSGDRDCVGLPNVLDPDDFDGPCASGDLATFQAAACAGASTTAAGQAPTVRASAGGGVRRL